MPDKASTSHRLSCFALVAALIAFPAGLIVGRWGDRSVGNSVPNTSIPAAAPHGTETRTRNLYAPNIADDPYVRSEQRRVVEALEAECRRTRSHCAEAQAARQWLERSGAAD